MWRNRSSLARMRFLSTATQPSTASVAASANVSTRTAWTGVHQEGFRNTATSAGERMRTRNVLGTAVPIPNPLLCAPSWTEQIPVTRRTLPFFHALVSGPLSPWGRLAVNMDLPEVSSSVVSAEARSRETSWPSIWMSWESYLPNRACSAVTRTAGTGRGCSGAGASEHRIRQHGRTALRTGEPRNVDPLAGARGRALIGLRAYPLRGIP